MRSPLDRAQEIVDDECINTDEDVRIIQALVNVARAADELMNQPIWDIDRSELREALAELNNKKKG